MIPPKPNILVLKLGGIGDAVAATPALRAIRDTFPEAFIALMAEQPAIQLIEKSPWIDRFIEYTDLYRCQGLAGLASARRLYAFSRLAVDLRSRRWDVFVCLQSLWRFSATLKPRLFAWMSRAPVRAGLDTAGNGAFLSCRVPDERVDRKHYAARFLDVARAIGCEAGDLRAEVWIDEDDRRSARVLLKRHGVRPGDSLVAIHPGANPDYTFRTSWPADRFAAVADAMARRGRRVLITGAASDRPISRRVLERMRGSRGRAVDLCGATSLRELAAVLERCDLVISNDTGPMHVAVAVGAPTVGIFGPGDWFGYGTYPEDVPFRMARTQVDCHPCHDWRCRTRECMRAVSPAQVMALAGQLLDQGSGRPGFPERSG